MKLTIVGKICCYILVVYIFAQRRCLLVAGISASGGHNDTVAAEDVIVGTGVLFRLLTRDTFGNGHVISLSPSGQNGLIMS